MKNVICLILVSFFCINAYSEEYDKKGFEKAVQHALKNYDNNLKPVNRKPAVDAMVDGPNCLNNTSSEYKRAKNYYKKKSGVSARHAELSNDINAFMCKTKETNGGNIARWLKQKAKTAGKYLKEIPNHGVDKHHQNFGIHYSSGE